MSTYHHQVRSGTNLQQMQMVGIDWHDRLAKAPCGRDLHVLRSRCSRKPLNGDLQNPLQRRMSSLITLRIVT